jgi:hypothetical protein
MTVAILVVLAVSAFVLPPFVSEYLEMAEREQRFAEDGGAEPGAESEFFATRRESRNTMRDLPPDIGKRTAIPLTTSPDFAFPAVFAYSVAGELPFKPEEVNPSYVDFHLGLSIAGNTDYLLLFLAEPTFAAYYEQGFPDAAALIAELKAEEVRGIIERVAGEFSVFTLPEETGGELQRLRQASPVLE